MRVFKRGRKLCDVTLSGEQFLICIIFQPSFCYVCSQKYEDENDQIC